MNFTQVQPLIENYGPTIDISKTVVEMELLKAKANGGVSYISRATTPQLMKLVDLRNTIAVSSTSAEQREHFLV